MFLSYTMEKRHGVSGRPGTLIVSRVGSNKAVSWPPYTAPVSMPILSAVKYGSSKMV